MPGPIVPTEGLQNSNPSYLRQPVIEVYQGDPAKNHKGPKAVQHGQVEIEKALGVLNQYDETTHMMGRDTTENIRK